jgi:hypothetical protein
MFKGRPGDTALSVAVWSQSHCTIEREFLMFSLYNKIDGKLHYKDLLRI